MLAKLWSLIVPFFLGFAVPVAAAQSSASDHADWTGVLEQSVRQQLATTATANGSAGASIKIDVKVGALDQRLQLAACQQIEPFLPTGAKLWGRSVIGVRCIRGANWSVTVPVQVNVTGPALVANGNLPAGQQTGEQDFRMEVLELSREPGPPVTDPAQLKGRMLTRSLGAGQILRAEHLRLAPTVSPGDTIRVNVLGQGFNLTYDGTAVNAAAEGQTVRVRSENGKILTGQLRDRSIEIRL